MRKGITEERYSYQKALQILTRELSTLRLQQQQDSHADPTEVNRVLDFTLAHQNRFQVKGFYYSKSQVKSTQRFNGLELIRIPLELAEILSRTVQHLKQDP